METLVCPERARSAPRCGSDVMLLDPGGAASFASARYS
jgi:hypothetical protein